MATYLNDHLAGATAGMDLFRRVAGSHSDPEVRASVGRMATEIEEDRESLLAIMRRLGVRPSMTYTVLGHVAERLGRFKPNGTLLRRSNLTDLVELEGLTLGVRGKLACWHMLRNLASNDPVLEEQELDDLCQRAESQLSQLEELRRRVGTSVLGEG